MATAGVVCVQSSKSTSQPAVAAAAAANDNEEEEEEGVKNMYIFEGKDYSKEPSAADCDAFQQLVDGICLFTHYCYYLGKLFTPVRLCVKVVLAYGR